MNENGNIKEVLYRAVDDSPISCVKAFVCEAQICGKSFGDMRKFIRWLK